VKSELTDDFRACFEKLPNRIKRQARASYQSWKMNPHHPSLEFKRVGRKSPIYSIRVGIGWRALGLKQRNNVTWFWIGSHASYDRLLKQM
jgi:hypothetical protein